MTPRNRNVKDTLLMMPAQGIPLLTQSTNQKVFTFWNQLAEEDGFSTYCEKLIKEKT